MDTRHCNISQVEVMQAISLNVKKTLHLKGTRFLASLIGDTEGKDALLCTSLTVVVQLDFNDYETEIPMLEIPLISE